LNKLLKGVATPGSNTAVGLSVSVGTREAWASLALYPKIIVSSPAVAIPGTSLWIAILSLRSNVPSVRARKIHNDVRGSRIMLVDCGKFLLTSVTNLAKFDTIYGAISIEVQKNVRLIVDCERGKSADCAFSQAVFEYHLGQARVIGGHLIELLWPAPNGLV
jgi:hypothetical protein